MSRRRAHVWRELFEGPPLDAAVRTEYARRVVGWMLAPLWLIMAISVAAGVSAAIKTEPLFRFIPAAFIVPVLLCVTQLRRKAKWMPAAALLCGGLLVAVGLAVLLNTVHAPVYQGGVVLLAMVVP